MDKEFLDAITKILSDFASARFSSQVLELVGPVQKDTSYRWRLMSTRFKEVTVLLTTKNHFFGKPSAEHFEVYGLSLTKKLGPTLDELRSFLESSELAPAG